MSQENRLSYEDALALFAQASDLCESIVLTSEGIFARSDVFGKLGASALFNLVNLLEPVGGKFNPFLFRVIVPVERLPDGFVWPPVSKQNEVAARQVLNLLRVIQVSYLRKPIYPLKISQSSFFSDALSKVFQKIYVFSGGAGDGN